MKKVKFIPMEVGSYDPAQGKGFVVPENSSRGSHFHCDQIKILVREDDGSIALLSGIVESPKEGDIVYVIQERRYGKLEVSIIVLQDNYLQILEAGSAV